MSEFERTRGEKDQIFRTSVQPEEARNKSSTDSNRHAYSDQTEILIQPLTQQQIHSTLAPHTQGPGLQSQHDSSHEDQLLAAVVQFAESTTTTQTNNQQYLCSLFFIIIIIIAITTVICLIW